MKWFFIDEEMTQYYFSTGIAGVLTDYYRDYDDISVRLNRI